MTTLPDRLSQACLIALLLTPLAWHSTVAAQEPEDPTEQPSARTILLQAFDLSKTAESAEQFTKMIELCEQGIELAANDSSRNYGRQLAGWAHNKRGEALTSGENPDEEAALADFEAAVKYDSRQWRHFHNRGVSYGLRGDYAKARADFDRVIQLQPSAKAYFNRGEVAAQLGDLNAAIADYTQAIRRQSNDSAAYNSRGFAYYERGPRYRNQAFSDFNQAIRLNSRNYEAYVNRGNLYADIGRFQQALADFQAAIGINNEFGPAYVSAAWLQATCPVASFRNGDAALQAAQRAVNLDGEHPRYLETLAAAHARAGQFEEAVAKQTEALAKLEGAAAQAAQTRLDAYAANQPYEDRIARQR